MRYFIVIIATMIFTTLFHSIDFSKNTTKFHFKGKVLAVGSCGGGEGFFAGNYGCSTKVILPNGEIEFWEVWGKVVQGQTVYKNCWKDEGENSKCFIHASTVPMKGH